MEKEIYTVEEVIVDEILVKDKCGAVYKIIGQPGKDGVDGKDGKDGRDGKDGKDGVDGAPGRNGTDGEYTMDDPEGGNGNDSGSYQGMFYATIYKSSVEKPARPTGGSYDFEEFTLTAPTGWKTAVSSDARNVWMSSRHFYPDGTEEDWSEPIRLIMSADELLDGANTLLRVVTIYTSNDSKPSLPTWSVMECGMDKAAWDNAIDKGEYPNFEIPQGDSLGWSLELPSSGLIWQSTNSFHSDGTLMGWTGPYKYVDIDGIMKDASAKAKEAADAAINAAENALNKATEEALELNQHITEFENVLATNGTDYTEIITNLGIFVSDYKPDSSNPDGGGTGGGTSSTLDAFKFEDTAYASTYIPISSANGDSLGKGEKTYTLTIPYGVYIYSLEARNDSGNLYTYLVKATYTPQNSTQSKEIINVSYPTSQNYFGKYYGILFVTENSSSTKLTIKRTDSCGGTAKIFVFKLENRSLSDIKQTATEISTKVGTLETSIDGIDSTVETYMQQHADEIIAAAADTLFATDVFVEIESGSYTTIDLPLLIDYYPSVLYYNLAEATTTPATATVYKSVNKQNKLIDLSSDVTNNHVTKAELPLDKKLYIYNTTTGKKIKVYFKYKISLAVGSINIDPDEVSLLATKVNDITNTDLSTGKVTVKPDAITSVVTDGEVTAAIIAGINKAANDQGSSFIQLTADTIALNGETFALQINATGLNIDNRTYIYGKDGSSNGADSIDATGELMCLGFGTKGESHFYKNGNISLAGGLISAGRYQYTNGVILYDNNGFPILDNEDLTNTKPMSLYVKGIINATAGQIGGWTIGNNYLYGEGKSEDGNNTFVLRLNPNLGIVCSNKTNTALKASPFALYTNGEGSLAFDNIHWDNDGSLSIKGAVTMEAGSNIAGTLTMSDSSSKKITAGLSGNTTNNNNILLWGGATTNLAVNADKNNYFLSGTSGEKINTLLKRDGTGKIGPFYIEEGTVRVNSGKDTTENVDVIGKEVVLTTNSISGILGKQKNTLSYFSSKKVGNNYILYSANEDLISVSKKVTDLTLKLNGTVKLTTSLFNMNQEDDSGMRIYDCYNYINYNFDIYDGSTLKKTITVPVGYSANSAYPTYTMSNWSIKISDFPTITSTCKVKVRITASCSYTVSNLTGYGGWDSQDRDIEYVNDQTIGVNSVSLTGSGTYNSLTNYDIKPSTIIAQDGIAVYKDLLHYITISNSGEILMIGLPTTKPSTSGTIWNDKGTLKIT